MASSSGNSKHSVAQQLQREPYRFSFVQAVRLIEKIRRRGRTDVHPIGGDAPPDKEAVRLVGDAALSFPSAEVVELKKLFSVADGLNSEQAELTAVFMGIYGASGVLPYFDTQRIIDTGLRKNAEKDLLDLFNHRILSYFYRASTKYRAPFEYERHVQSAGKGDILLTTMMRAIAGIATPGLQERMAFPDELIIEFCQYFGLRTKNAVSLTRMLNSYFGHPVQVQQFQGQWLTLSSESKSSMPDRLMPLGQNCQLGRNFIVGDRVWDVQSRFRVRFGPLDRDEFNTLLPGSIRLRKAAQLIRLYAGIQLDFDIQLELESQQVPDTVLDGTSSRLGMNSWLISQAPSANKDEAIFMPTGQPER